MAGGSDIMWFQPGKPCCGECTNWEVHQSNYRLEFVSKTQSDRELYFFSTDGLAGMFSSVTHAVAFGAQRYYSMRHIYNQWGRFDLGVFWSRDAIDQDVTGDVLDRTAAWTFVHAQFATNSDQTFGGRSIDVNEQDNLLMWINLEQSFVAGTLVVFTHLWKSDMDGGSPSLIGSFPVPPGSTSPQQWYPVKLHMNHYTGKTYIYEQCGAYLFPDDTRWAEYDTGQEYVGAPTYFQQGIAFLGTSLDREHNQIYAKARVNLPSAMYSLCRIDLTAKTLHEIIIGVATPYHKQGASAAWSVRQSKVMVATYGQIGESPPDDSKSGFYLVPYDDSGVEWATSYDDMQLIWTEAFSREFTLGRCYETFGTAGKQTTNCNA